MVKRSIMSRPEAASIGIAVILLISKQFHIERTSCGLIALLRITQRKRIALEDTNLKFTQCSIEVSEGAGFALS
jgi:hypothetical protein